MHTIIVLQLQLYFEHTMEWVNLKNSTNFLALIHHVQLLHVEIEIEIKSMVSPV